MVSDWSSDVCSSDLAVVVGWEVHGHVRHESAMRLVDLDFRFSRLPLRLAQLKIAAWGRLHPDDYVAHALVRTDHPFLLRLLILAASLANWNVLRLLSSSFEIDFLWGRRLPGERDLAFERAG